MEVQVLIEFKKHSIYRLEEGLRMMHKSIEFIDENELWQLPFQNGMSLGNQLLHSCGNMRQYIFSSLGNQVDSRVRDEEFKINNQLDKYTLLKNLDETVEISIQTIERTNQEEYLRIRKVQGFSFSGLGVLLHAVEHFSYHVGQTAFWVKYLTQQDLEFFDGINLNEKNTTDAN